VRGISIGCYDKIVSRQIQKKNTVSKDNRSLLERANVICEGNRHSLRILFRAEHQLEVGSFEVRDGKSDFCNGLLIYTSMQIYSLV